MIFIYNNEFGFHVILKCEHLLMYSSAFSQITYRMHNNYQISTKLGLVLLFYISHDWTGFLKLHALGS